MTRTPVKCNSLAFAWSVWCKRQMKAAASQRIRWLCRSSLKQILHSRRHETASTRWSPLRRHSGEAAFGLLVFGPARSGISPSKLGKAMKPQGSGSAAVTAASHTWSCFTRAARHRKRAPSGWRRCTGRPDARVWQVVSSWSSARSTKSKKSCCSTTFCDAARRAACARGPALSPRRGGRAWLAPPGAWIRKTGTCYRSCRPLPGRGKRPSSSAWRARRQPAVLRRSKKAGLSSHRLI